MLILLLLLVINIIIINSYINNNINQYNHYKKPKPLITLYSSSNDIDSSIQNMVRNDVLSKAEEEINKANDNPNNNAIKSTTARSKKAKDMIKTAREKSGYVFKKKGDYEEYDVPYIDKPMWFRLSVRKTSEQSLCDKFLGMKEEDPRWNRIIEDTFFPQSPFYALNKGKVVMKGRPLVPGVVYLKTIMRPEIADVIENINGIYGFAKSPQQLILPLPEDEGEELEGVKIQWEGRKLNEDMARLKKDEYVSVVDGTHTGKYGILMGAKSGKLEVCIRNDGYKDDWDVFDASELRYLSEPPEKKWKEMTAKEAVESLMAKDPQNAYLKALKKGGLLKDILYPEGRNFERKDSFNTADWDNRGGAEGGKRIRSIAKDDTKERPPQPRKFDKWEPNRTDRQMGDRSNRYENDATDNDFFSVKTNSDATVNSNTIDDDWDFVNSLFDDIDSSAKPKTTTKATDKNKSSSNNDNNDAVKSDFNNLINNILDDMVKDKPSSSSSSSSSDKKSNSDKAIKDFLKDLSNDSGSSKKKGDLNEFFDTAQGRGGQPPKNNIPDDDDLDFDKLFGDLDELDTIFSDSSSNSKSKSTKKITTTSSETTKTDSKVPSMEDYPTFEAYLDALVSYERSNPTNPSSRNGRRNDFNSYNNNNNNNYKNANNKKGLDDEVLDILREKGANPSIDTPKKVYNFKEKTDNDEKSVVNLESLTLKELKVIAKEKGLPVSGRKDELLSRVIASGK